MSVLHKIEEWKTQLEQAKDYGYHFDKETVSEMIEAMDHQQTQIELLITIIDGCQKLAEHVGDKWVKEYINDFKDNVMKNTQ